MKHARKGPTSWSVLLSTGLLFVVAACASAPVAAPRTQVHLEPVRQDAAEPTAPLPSVPSISGDSRANRAEPRLFLTAVNQDLGVVVRELAARSGLQYQIDPEVHGTVNTVLRNKTLPEALASIMPQGMTYQIQGGVLRVGPARLTTRIFSLDYVALSRVGTASTIIQRRLGVSGTGVFSSGATGFGGGAGAAGFGGGADAITAVSVADVWEEIRVSMDALVFDAPVTGQAQGTQPAASGALGAGGTGGAGRPYSRVAADGRRLIINPIAGTITVTALPAQLEQLEIFIRAFESSIQRQVLIEAKIVEVNLDRSFQFGIDWNVLARAGTASIGISSVAPGTLRTPATPGSARAGNVEFTLSGGPGQITAVLNALSSQGDVRVLSSPRVSALNNQRAVFDVTTGEIVFTVTQTPIVDPSGRTTFLSQVSPTQVNVGIVLDVLAQIGADNAVTMNIRPVVTSVARTATFTSQEGAVFQAPVIDTRETDTMARLRAGETIIIGGLMQTRREKTRSGVPGLRSIPLLGRLFTSYSDVEKKAELVIFLTPTIIAGQPVAAR
jgi:MSHA biogenesis protein MshL